MMSKQQAIDLVQKTFESPFDKTKFVVFIKDLLNHIEDAPFIRQGNYIPDQFRPFVSHYERIGKYSDGEHRLDILIVYLKKEASIERARSMQRNFIAGYLQGKYGTDSAKDAALVAFVSPTVDDWRFSLVRMEYKLIETAKGGIKAKEEYSPARRWSFLVGKHEKSHTAQSRLVPIIADDEHNPTLAELEEAFNIERVTKEFFEKYRGLFIWTKQELDQVLRTDPQVQTDFKNKAINTVDLAKKLLGQITFLYYLQKKGWFGVPRNASWGEGSKSFLRELFEKKHGDYMNFFNDILEPLFYEALRMDRSYDDHYYSRFNCKIPFLNGGLFDPMNNYDWVKTDILLSNDLFSNKNKTKEGDTGDGILDVFDRYNFTVKEDEPFEKEVAIDPELLGKAYEKFNAIRPDNYDEFLDALKSEKKGEESKFNKQYGVYYTPREIVHYMCQQSLINYLYSELNPEAVYQKLDDLQLDLLGNEAKKGQLDLMKEHHPASVISKEDISFLIQHGENWRENEAHVDDAGKETGKYSFKLPESIRKNAALIDEKIASIRVCDPAVGSGAFPVGMMSEIVKARQVLEIFTKTDKTNYDYKRECIENSLYGVDIDQGAVEIAKLRLWLSLVVDEEDPQNIKPLPNLDYKIVCGNSLVGYPENWGSPIEKEIESLIHQHFNESNPTIKTKLKTLIDEKIESRYNNSLRTFGYSVSFDFRTVFSEVFHKNNGFDVVIGNPPYVRQEEIKDFKPILEKQFRSYTSTADLYVYFFEKGIRLLRDKGIFVFISSNKYFHSGYGEKIRQYLKINTSLNLLIDFGELPVFENAATFPAIILTRKMKSATQEFLYAPIKRLDYYSLDEEVKSIGLGLNETVLRDGNWLLTNTNQQSLVEKMRQIGVSFDKYTQGKVYYGIKTGYDAAFIIDLSTQNRIISQDPFCVDLIKPYVIGDDLRNYQVNFKERYLILIPKGWTNKNSGKSKDKWIWFQNAYPAIANHLIHHENAAKKRTDQGDYWWELRACSYYDLFECPKLVYPEIARESRFAFDDKGFYCNKTTFMVPQKDLYLLGILNSKLSWLFLKSTCSVLGDPEKGGRLLLQYSYLKHLPIPLPELDQRNKITELVEKILVAKQANPLTDVSKFEAEIDNLVYRLYGLTENEITIIKNK